MALEEQIQTFLRSKIEAKKSADGKIEIDTGMYQIAQQPIPYKLFLVSRAGGAVFLSDEGYVMTELDKIFELKEPDVQKNLIAIMRQYGCRKEGKNIVIDCTPRDLNVKISYLVQCLSFMLNMKIFYV
ncbi:MAG: DUF1828 domain-containing protein [Christensenellaceae bacterium]|jgi:hypothetical protein|nr:DUF1828 domain-containing protein [Christensenellaceae bacterium]